MNNHSIIEQMLHELPFSAQREALSYMEFLSKKYKATRTKSKKEFRFDWRGGLSSLKQKYSSVELQHKAAEWRG